MYLKINLKFLVSDDMLNNILGKIDKHIHENFNDK
jgi:hypothetical protein